MTTIICPTRGGKASYPNQDRAIALAKERQARLIFLYISNVQFLGLTASPVVVDLEAELDEMGEFILTMAQERAEKAGLSAEITVRRGLFSEVLIAVIQEYQADTVVLGKAEQGTGLTTQEYLEGMMEEVAGETGVEFILVQSGEIAGIYRPE